MNYYFIEVAEGYDWIWSKEVELRGYTSNFRAKPMKDTWKIPNLEYVEGKGKKKFDVCSACSPLYFFSRKAIDVLEDILTKYGELLPVNSPKDNFIAFHCTNLIDALDINKSTINWLDKEKGWIDYIDKYVLKDEVVNDNEIFRIPQDLSSSTFFGEEFKKRVIENNLKAFDLKKYNIKLI